MREPTGIGLTVQHASAGTRGEWTRIDGSHSLFVALWAGALLVHQVLRLVFQGYTPFDAAAAVVFGLAVVVPRAPLVLPSVAVVQLVSLWIDLPRAANHWMLAGFVNLSILGTLGAEAWRVRGGGRSGGDEFLAALGPLVRWEVILVYLVAAFHKLNSDFLDPDVGCLGWVAHFAAQQSGVEAIARFPRLTALVAAATVAVEFAIPVLLARRRTWLHGVALGVLFHLASFETGFTAVAIALYFFFVPAREPRSVSREFDEFLRKRSGGVLTLGRVIRAYVLLFLFVVPTSYVQDWMGGRAAVLIPAIRSVLWIAALLVICAAILRFFHAAGVHRLLAPRGAGPASRVLYVLPALLLVNGLCPYLGLKTTTSFDMFSNLRVLGERSNHLVLRNHPLRIFGYQRDLVSVRTASDPSLTRLSARGPLPYVQFKREVQARARPWRAPLVVVYERRGQVHRVANAAADAELMSAESIFARKFLPFRPEPWNPARGCPW